MNKSWKIIELEKKLDKKIRQNTISIGFDVAERHTGIAVLKSQKATLELIKLHKINTTQPSLIESMNYFICELNNFVSTLNLKGNYKIFVIEDCFYGLNVKTLKALARFSALVWRELHHISDEIYFIMPSSARAKIGFKKDKNNKKSAKEQVLDYINKLLNLKIEDKDLSDGVVLALSGLLEL